MDKEKELKKEIKKLEKEKEKLKENETVKLYLYTKALIRRKNQELALYHEEVMYEKYDNCHHYYIYSRIHLGIGETYAPVCVLCGLNRRTLGGSEESKIMRRYVTIHEWRGHNEHKSRGYTYYCDANLANKIIKYIKKNNNDISEDELINQFEVIMDSMSNPSTDKETVKIMAKRLNTSIRSLNAIHKNN